MDLRDEVSGTEGTIWLDHFLRTGFEMYTAVGQGGYVAEKAEGDKGWLFPVGDEVHELGYVHMFTDMFDALDEGRQPTETFYDGYIVNAVIDACYRSAVTKRWEPIDIKHWASTEAAAKASLGARVREERYDVIKEERMPEGNSKVILKDRNTGEITERIERK